MNKKNANTHSPYASSYETLTEDCHSIYLASLEEDGDGEKLN